MFFAIAALLMQPGFTPHLSTFSAENVARIEPASASSLSNIPASESSSSAAPLVADASAPDTSVQPPAEPSRASLPDALVADPAVNTPRALILSKPGKDMTISVAELRAENRSRQFAWRGLVIATASAATFDAWTTRHVLTTMPNTQELNPMLKPFAGNSSLYAAIQVGPLLMDYAGKKMMYSRYTLVRRLWWVPQTASVASSLFCGSHNLGVH